MTQIAYYRFRLVLVKLSWSVGISTLCLVNVKASFMADAREMLTDFRLIKNVSTFV